MRLGSFLGRLEGVFKRPRGSSRHFEVFGGILKRFGGVLGASWSVLGASWGVLVRVGSFLGRLEGVFKRPRDVLEAS